MIRYMANERKCIVRIVDHEGVEHSLDVVAETLYEAAAIGLQQLRRSEWSREASLDAAILQD
jgi:hypothetical protein